MTFPIFEPGGVFALLGYGGTFALGVLVTLVYRRLINLGLNWLLRTRSPRWRKGVKALVLFSYVFRQGLFFAFLCLLVIWLELNVVALIAGILVYQGYRMLIMFLWPQRYLRSELQGWGYPDIQVLGLPAKTG